MRAKYFVRWSGLFGAITMVACLTSKSESPLPLTQVNTSPTPQVVSELSSTTSPQSLIRSVDFANFTYRTEHLHIADDLTLYQGRYEGSEDHDTVVLTNIAYGDVTNDEAEEAVVVLFLGSRGTAKTYFVYIYALQNETPELLWAFSTGDRAAGGLRQSYAESGNLIIELYGRNKVIGRDLYADNMMAGGACCPTHFTRARYEWRNNRFQQILEEEILPNPVGGAPVIMPRFHLSN